MDDQSDFPMPLPGPGSAAVAAPPMPVPGGGGIQYTDPDPRQDSYGDPRSYAEPPPAPSASMTPQMLKQAQDAVAAAMRFQGSRAFSEDVQAGTPPEVAILKHGPKMFFNNPAGYATALKNSKATAQFSPEVIDVAPGVRAVRISPQHVQILDKGNEPGTVERQLQMVNLRGEHALRHSMVLPEQIAESDKRIAGIEDKIRRTIKGPPIHKGADKEMHRAQGLKLLGDPRYKADEVRARFQQTYGEPLEQ